MCLLTKCNEKNEKLLRKMIALAQLGETLNPQILIFIHFFHIFQHN